MRPKLEKLTLELIRRCPNQCLHCSTSSGPAAEDTITLDVAKSIIHQAVPLGLKTVILSGGEPLCYPRLVELIKHVSALRLSVVVYTSGSVLDQAGRPAEAPSSITDHFQAGLVERFNVSIHSHSADVHDRFMQTAGSWKRAWNFVRRVKIYGNCVHVHSVVTKFNYATICELASCLHDEGVQVLRLLRLVPQGRARNRYQQLALTPRDWQVVRRQLNEITSDPRLSLDVRLGGHISVATDSPGYECSLDSPKLVIQPDGNVAVCPALKGLSGSLGSPSIFRDSLIDITQSGWRQDVAELKAPPGSDCPAQRLYAEFALQTNHTETLHGVRSSNFNGRFAHRLS